ncbi:glycosyltransferase family 9 protein [Enterobacter asburiae]|uniref:glycosyltransferase family 9 protein n=1 Tax=Enterobacter asburiae TaxID=61645 RepID=UPI002A5293E9|nr:glycosyltransferase family 9 protein [Enterobacter hormaechei]
MNNLIKKIKHINRKRNFKTKYYKLRLRIVATDAIFRRRSVLPAHPQTILIMMIGKGIGDGIVMTGLIKALTTKGYKVSVIAESRLNAIFSEHPLLQNYFILHRDRSDYETLSKVRSSRFDILIDLDDIDAHSPLRVKTIRACKPIHTIGVNQFARVYDTTINNIGMGKHISERHILIAKTLGCHIENLEYAVNFRQSDDIAARQFLELMKPSTLIILNPYGTEESRNMSIQQIINTCSLLKDKLNIITVIIGAPDKVKNIPNNKNYVKFLSPDFCHAIALVKHADLIISTDTSIVHLCNAFNKKLISLYNNKISPRGEKNNIVWGPNYAKAVQLFSNGNRIDEIQADDIVSATVSLLCIN